MSEKTQSDLRDAIDVMKNDSGSGTKERKQNRFVDVYQPEVAHIVAGERYDSAGVGPMTAQRAVENVYPDLNIDDYDTISEALIGTDGGKEESLAALVSDLDAVAESSGNEQQELIEVCLRRHSQPSLVTLALLDDENIGLGASQMREAFFDGTRDERKRREAFTNTTSEFISLAQQDQLPDAPTVGEPFSPMLAVPESRGEPDNSVAQMKIDGYRVLIHIEDGDATAYSRQRNDITASLPELNEIDWPNGDFILDAEVLAETGSYSDTSERIGRSAENVERDVEMTFQVFDCIVYQGNDVSGSAFLDRFNMAMDTAYGIDDYRVDVLSVWHDIAQAKDDALAQDKEGIIVKDRFAPYEFGKRSAYWQKQKYDASTIDVIVTGFHEGTGEASGTLGAVDIESLDGVPLGRSGSGFSDAERDLIWNNQDEWHGEVIEVEARGLGSEGHLRMPIYKQHRVEGEADPMERIEEIMKNV